MAQCSNQLNQHSSQEDLGLFFQTIQCKKSRVENTQKKSKTKKTYIPVVFLHSCVSYLISIFIDVPLQLRQVPSTIPNLRSWTHEIQSLKLWKNSWSTHHLSIPKPEPCGSDISYLDCYFAMLFSSLKSMLKESLFTFIIPCKEDVSLQDSEELSTRASSS